MEKWLVDFFGDVASWKYADFLKIKLELGKQMGFHAWGSL